MSGVLGGLIGSLKKLITLNFVEQAVPTTTFVKREVAWAGNLSGNGYFIMVYPGTSTTSSGTRYAYSTTGATGSWTESNLPSSVTWGTTLANGAGTRVLVIAGWINQSSNVSAYTDNGTTWTAQTMPSSASWTGKTINGTFYCTNRSTSNNFAYSTTGATGSWTTATVAAVTTLRDIAGTPSGTFVIVGTSNVLYRSTNLTSWSANTTNIITNLTGVEYGNGVFVAVAPNLTAYRYSTDDGLTWTAGAFPSLTANVTTVLVAFSQVAKKFIMVLANGNVATSDNGVTWTTSSLATMTTGRIYGYAESPTAAVLMGTNNGEASSRYFRSTL